MELKFIDLFAGCGGLSLGLMQAGIKGVFAIEKDPMAFATLEKNLSSGCIEKGINGFDWPIWLEKKNYTIDEFIKVHDRELKELKGTIDILAGGPPCQGFSYTGKRDGNDPRNLLFKRYIQVVKFILPRAVVIENVPGIKTTYKSDLGKILKNNSNKISFLEKIINELDDLGYISKPFILNASDFGVPQKRKRVIIVGFRNNICSTKLMEYFEIGLSEIQASWEKYLGLPEGIKITAGEVLSDLLSIGVKKVKCEDAFSKNFKQIVYSGPKTSFQSYIHKGSNGEMDSMRLVNHTKKVEKRFTDILKHCRKGVRMDEDDRSMFNLKKFRIYPMAEYDLAPTITTLPDDVLHYCEPRILTVRECARIQSFPDWFRFEGKYTTGGKERVKECPRYTQVGNAVPPLLAKAIGISIKKVLLEKK